MDDVVDDDLGSAIRAHKWRWLMRRWTLKHLLHRAGLPARRRRWRRQREEVCRSYAKQTGAIPTKGPALVFGEFSGKHGLGRAATYDIELLRARHEHVQTVDLCPYLTGGAVSRLTFNGPVENLYLFCQPDRYGTVFGLLDADAIRNAYRIGRWVWETPVFPEDWRFAERLVHEIWAPSSFCAETFRRAIDVPVSVLPHFVTEPPETSVNMRSHLSIPPDVFMGLAIMDIQSCPARKNPWAHVLAWRRAFGDDPTAILVMKIRVSKRTQTVLKELHELARGASNIRLISEDLEHSEIAALHRAADLYMSLHCAEGFGLNIYEALLLGKPVVATNWSANAEYGPLFENYRGVDYKLVPYQDWLQHYGDNKFLWAEADIAHAGRLLSQSREAMTYFSRDTMIKSGSTSSDMKTLNADEGSLVELAQVRKRLISKKIG